MQPSNSRFYCSVLRSLTLRSYSLPLSRRRSATRVGPVGTPWLILSAIFSEFAFNRGLNNYCDYWGSPKVVDLALAEFDLLPNRLLTRMFFSGRDTDS